MAPKNQDDYGGQNLIDDIANGIDINDVDKKIEEVATPESIKDKEPSPYGFRGIFGYFRKS